MHCAYPFVSGAGTPCTEQNDVCKCELVRDLKHTDTELVQVSVDLLAIGVEVEVASFFSFSSWFRSSV